MKTHLGFNFWQNKIGTRGSLNYILEAQAEIGLKDIYSVTAKNLKGLGNIFEYAVYGTHMRSTEAVDYSYSFSKSYHDRETYKSKQRFGALDFKVEEERY